MTVPAPSRHPELVGARRDIVLTRHCEHEHEMVLIEVSEPFIPIDRPESRRTGEIEANSGAAVVHVHGGWTGRRGFASGRFGLLASGPLQDHLMIARRGKSSRRLARG